MKYHKSICLLFFVILLGCGGTREIASGVADASLSAKRVMKQHYKSEFEFETLACRVGTTYEKGNSSRSLTVSLRMEKDKTIWASASILGVTLAKILIEPNRVQYYETLSNTYFDGDFSLLSDWLRVDVNFAMLQNLLLGQTVVMLDQQSVLMTVQNNRYKLQPKMQDQDALYRFMLLLHPEHFKAASQQLMQPYKQQMLVVDYPSYQEINEQAFPKEIRVTATENQEQIRILLEYKKVDYNPEIRFPFSIPKGYDEIQLY